MVVKSQKTDLHIAACCDQNYLPYTAVMMVSAARRLDQAYRPVFHFVAVDIADHWLTRLSEEVTRHGGDLKVYQPDTTAFKGLPTLRYGDAVYHRILLAEYLPEDIHRVIYIDADTYVVDDIAKLWQTDLSGHPVGAVEDLSRSACKTIDIPRPKYFNSGVLVMDLDAWRQQGIARKVVRYAADNAHRLNYVDQCSLNAVLHKDWARLPPRWNQQATVYKALNRHSAGSGYEKAELREAIRNPAIYHFTGREKPWLWYCFAPVKHEYRALLDSLEWTEELRPKENLGDKLEAVLSLRKQAQYLGRLMVWLFHRKRGSH
ncbi:glycosyltransferase family 8 protein [Marinobacter sp.]|uniref:glycosyltransferase family 8 protein n=1 Tax=Marinobacter sp. TaxID=50741 RepID=UPI00299D4C39|nr:glycosyltransferase family 8 protein [Marinobacter sp.]